MYVNLIRETLARQGRIGVNPYHVEAWMRLEYGTLDHLGGAGWNRAVREAAECVAASTPAESESLAKSYGCAEPAPALHIEGGGVIKGGEVVARIEL